MISRRAAAALSAGIIVLGFAASVASAAAPRTCSWVYDATRCRNVDEWRAQAARWCERAARSTSRRWAMQRSGYATNRLFMTPMAGEFARENAFEAVAGQMCAGEQTGLAKAAAASAADMDH